MIITPTVEQFMAWTDPDEDDVQLEHDVEPLEPGASTALESIAVSLQTLVGLAQASTDEEKASDRLREAHDDLDAKAGVMLELIEEIEAIVKPSTSKLANSVREALDRWRGVPAEPEEPSGEPEPIVAGAQQCPSCARYFADGELLERHACTTQLPAHDAPIEDWVAYAQAQGHDVDPGRTNRSQIRTLLGIVHPAAEAS